MSHDESHRIHLEDIELDENLTYDQGSISVLDSQVWQLRSKKVASVKVVWQNHQTGESTWESEEETQVRYP